MLLLAVLSIIAAGARFLLRYEKPGEVSGWAHVIDGDSLQVAGREVRLVGIDAPEWSQTCSRDGKNWDCGQAARAQLRRLIGMGRVTCRYSERDQYDRLLGLCDAGGRSLNKAMVEAGFAVAYGRFGAEEGKARADHRGIWAAEFERPQEWRRQHRAAR